ncbi:hypothetical protein pdam_00020949 [Pocillopora damicornis]|uniref:EGF-like domain-containing protein n=1 Tax=Pocillopora damicornis TaxID=46731 RepID=A0A3M6TUW4_POCDA|nr:hypothetical protein pdam_00020949 [Pocillopora damicornis]
MLVLQADNGKYLSLIDRNSRNSFEAARNNTDSFGGNFGERLFSKTKHYHLNVPHVGMITVMNEMECLFKCCRSHLCLSVNMSPSKGRDGKLWCELLSSDKYRNVDKLKANKSSHYYCVELSCFNNPCKNGGTWQPVHGARECGNDSTCVCAAGFRGKSCEQNVTLSLDGFWPVGVALKGYNGKYLSRKHRSGIDYIEMAKSQKDSTTRFVATESNGKLMLTADNGKYLSRVRRANVDYIEAAKTYPDTFSQFTVHDQPDGTVALQADNGKYLSLIDRNSRNSFEAAKDNIDSHCKLKREIQG